MIVVDASVAVKTYLDEAGTDAATELMTGQERLLAPEIIRLEVAGAISRRVRRGELEASDAAVRCRHWIVQLDRGLISLTSDRDLIEDAFVLSTKIKHPLADCLYLETARRHKARLITADKPFMEQCSPHYPRIELLPGCKSN